MEEVEVIRTGETSDGRNWALIKKIESGFELTAMVNPTELPEVGDTLKLPAIVAKSIDWSA